MLHSVQFFSELGVLLAIFPNPHEPGVAKLLASFSDTFTEVFVDTILHVEFLVFWPAVIALSKPDLLFSQRFTVGATRVLFVRRAIAYVAVHNDQRRTIFAVQESSIRPGQHVEVVCVTDARHVPTVADETRSYILCKVQGGVAFDSDVVVIINPAEIRKPQMASERGGLTGDAFHHASIAAKRVDIEIE